MRHPFLSRFDHSGRSGSSGGVPRFTLDYDSIAEDFEIGWSVTSLLINGDTNDPNYTSFVIVDDPDGRFSISGSTLFLAALVDYETKSSHDVSIMAIHATDPTKNIVKTFTIQVENLAEGLLGPTVASFISGAAPGTVVCDITGLDVSVNERLLAILYPANNKVVISPDGMQLLVGTNLQSAGQTETLSIVTNRGRNLNIDVTAQSAEQPIYRVATRQYGTGYNAESVALTGDGSTKTYTTSLVNESGRQMDTVAIAFQGWGLITTGTQPVGNDNTMSGTITYNGVTQNFQDVVVPNGDDTQNADLALSTPIPAGASFSINLSSPVASGAKYPPRLGFAGVLTKALESELEPAFYGIGDSIATNNGAALMNASIGKCPVYQASIVGTTAQAYGENTANFLRQKNLAKRLGADFFCDFGTNDLIASKTPAQILGWLKNMRDLAKADGIGWIQTTMLPRVTKKAAVAVTSLTSDGISNRMKIKVADASIFTIGQAYSVAGATPAGYNGSTICDGLDLAQNEATFICANGLASPATGTITITARNPTNTAYWQQPANSNYNPGAASPRGVFNTAVRNGPSSGDFDAFVDWADAVEPFRDSGRFAVAGEKGKLPLPVIATVIAGGTRTTTRFNTDYGVGSSTTANGLVQFITGANAGQLKGASNNTAGDITLLTALTAAPAVGDKMWVWPGVCYQSDDGIHDRVSTGGMGGQVLLDDETQEFLIEAIAA
jgi:hypothetical protein